MTDPNFFIETPRLYLSHFQPASDRHCDFLLAVANSPESQKANASVMAPVTDREGMRKKIESLVEDQAKTGYGRFLVSLKPAPIDADLKDERSFEERQKAMEMLGVISLKIRGDPQAPMTPVPDIGYNMMRAYWGKGYATEAAQAVLDYFEKEKGLKEAFGYTSPTNEDSKRMLKRLGFEDRGMRVLKGLGDSEKVKNGFEVMVWARKGMHEDLSVYGL